jgi:hypothetical protein
MIWPVAICRWHSHWWVKARNDPRPVRSGHRGKFFLDHDVNRDEGDPIIGCYRIPETAAIQWLLADGYSLPDDLSPPPVAPRSAGEPDLTVHAEAADSAEHTRQLVPYRPLRGGTAWFDPASPTQFWTGVRRWDDAGVHKGHWHLHRTLDGAWICHFSFDESRRFEPADGQGRVHWQITPKQAERWFALNQQSPPEVLCKDLEEAATGQDPTLPGAASIADETASGIVTPESPSPTAPFQASHCGAAGGQVDELSIAEVLRQKGFPLEAAFVRRFQGRSSATWQELVESVCPGEDRDWAAVKTWAYRVKNAMAKFFPERPLRFHTTRRGHIVFKETRTE